MSDTAPDKPAENAPDSSPDSSANSSAAPTPEPAGEKTKSKPARSRGQKWRRRIIAFLIIFIAGFTLVRAIVPMLLPTVLRRVASSYGLNAEYDRFDFNMLGADVGLWNLRFTPQSGGEPVITIEYCRGAVDTFALVRGKLHVERAEAEGANVTLERLPDGSIPLIEKLLAVPKNQTTTVSTPAGPTEIPLEPPLAITALRVQHAQARLVDRMVTPTTDVRFSLDMILNDIGSATAPTRFSIQLNSPELLGALYIDGTGTARNKLVNADLNIRMFGLNPQPVRAYLAAFGITPVSTNISANALGKLTMTPAGYSATQPADPNAPEKPTTAVAIKLDLHDISLTADSQYAAAVKTVKIDVPTAAPGEIRVAEVLVDGVRGYAWRDAQGRPGFAGFALGASPSSVAAVPVEKTSADKRPADRPTPTISPAGISALPVMELQSLIVTDVKLQVDDFVMEPAVVLAFDLDRIDIKKISTDPKHANIPSTISLRATAPGLARAITVAGDLSASKPTKTVALNLKVDGIDGAILDPYLAPLGITRAMQDASFSCDLNANLTPATDGSLGLGLSLTKVRLADKQNEWFGFPRVDIADVKVAADARRIRLGKIDIQGPSLGIRRAADGAITTFGFTLDPQKIQAAPAPAAVAGAPAPTTRPATAAAPLNLPVIEIGHLTWKEVSLAFEDLASSPPVSVGLKDVNVELADLTLDSTAASSKPGTLKVSLAAPGNVQAFTLDGTIAPTGESIAFDLAGNADGVSLASLKPILGTLGLEPAMKAAAFKFRAGGDVRVAEGKVFATANAKEVSLIDGQTPWLKLAGASINKASFDGKVATIESIVLDQPSLLVDRDEKGRLAAAGIRLVPAVGGPPPPPVDPTAPPVPSRVEIALPIVARLNELKVNNAQIEWNDRAVTPAAKLLPKATVSLKNFVAGEESAPAALDVTASIPGVIESVKVTGTVLAAPTKQGVDLVVAGQGISGNALQPYLPPGITPSAKDGTLAAKFIAQIAQNPAGGSSISVVARDVLLDDKLRPEPAIKLASAQLRVDRFDLPGKVVAIKEISTDGFAVRAFEDDRGIVLPGLVLGAAPAPANAAEAAKPPAAPEQALAGQAASVDQLVAGAKVTAPNITVEKIAIRADRIALQTKAMAFPVALSNISVNSQNIDLLGDQPTRRPPFDLTATASVDKLVDSINFTSTLRPFASEPLAKLNLNVTGIRGTEVTALMPELAKLIDAKELSDGSLTTNVEAQFAFTRRGILGVDTTRDITVNFTVRNTQLSQAGQERPLGAVEEVRGDKVRFSPATRNVVIKSIDIVKPSAHIVRDAEGIHALGFMLKMPTAAKPTTEPATPPAAEETAVAATEPPAAETTPAAASPSSQGDIRIDSLTVSGVDLMLEDKVGIPHSRLPVSDVDLEVRGLNTRILREDLPIRFNMLASGGKVGFEREDGTVTEPRELFAQFSASGEVRMFPKPNGWIKSSLSSFELASVRGLAQEQGIKLGGGTFDFGADVRMEGLDTFNAKLYPTLNNLRVSDSPDGVIARFLKIQVPLDMAITAVEDADGAISLPVVAPIQANNIQYGPIVASATGAIGAQIASAVAALPMKIAAMAGIKISTEKDLSPAVVPFAAGESLLTTDQQNELKKAIQRMKADDTLTVTLVHGLGSDDLVTSEQRANPSREDAAQLAGQLRQRKFDLQRERIEQTAMLRVALASQNKALSDQTLERLQQVSRELSQTEDGLDEMLALLRPGAQRQNDRRTKAAAIRLGQYRLETIKAELLASGIKNIAGRLNVVNARAVVAEGAAQGAVTLAFNRQAKSQK